MQGWVLSGGFFLCWKKGRIRHCPGAKFSRVPRRQGQYEELGGPCLPFALSAIMGCEGEGGQETGWKGGPVGPGRTPAASPPTILDPFVSVCATPASSMSFEHHGWSKMSFPDSLEPLPRQPPHLWGSHADPWGHTNPWIWGGARCGIQAGWLWLLWVGWDPQNPP